MAQLLQIAAGCGCWPSNVACLLLPRMSALSGLLSRVIPMQGCRPCPRLATADACGNRQFWLTITLAADTW